MIEHLVRLAENSAWSNFRLHHACAGLSTEDLGAKRTSFFPSITHTLNHILTVDWYYFDALTNGGKGYAIFDVEIPFTELAPLAEAQRKVDLDLVAFARGLTSGTSKVSIPRRDHVQVETVEDTLMHLFTHSIHHRGQAHAMLAGTSVKPPQLDEFFMSEELPLREAELRELGLPVR